VKQSVEGLGKCILRILAAYWWTASLRRPVLADPLHVTPEVQCWHVNPSHPHILVGLRQAVAVEGQLLAAPQLLLAQRAAQLRGVQTLRRRFKLLVRWRAGSVDA
jgi:hypothetical protein